MDLTQLANLGEFIGGVAVLVTLVYLAVQVRQNTAQQSEGARAARLGATLSTREAFSRFRHLVTQPHLSELFVRGCESYRSLGEAERLQFRAIMEEYFFAYQSLWTQMDEGVLLNEAWDAQCGALRELLGAQGVSEWWNDRKRLFEPTFVAALAVELRAPGPA